MYDGNEVHTGRKILKIFDNATAAYGREAPLAIRSAGVDPLRTLNVQMLHRLLWGKCVFRIDAETCRLLEVGP